MKIRGISEADVAARIDCAMKAPQFKLLTFEELDAMPVDPDYDPFAMIGQRPICHPRSSVAAGRGFQPD
jgi:hypothetical protein